MARTRGGDVDGDQHGRPPLRTGPTLAVLAAVTAVVLLAGTALEDVRVRGVDGAPMPVRVLVFQGARLFYADAEANVWAWLSSAVLGLLAAVLALSCAASRAVGGRWRSLAVLAVAALVLSVDEGAMLHEGLNEVGKQVTGSLGPHNAWLLPGVVVVAVAGALLLRVARALDPRLRRRLVVAGALFLAGALGTEAVGAAFALSSDLSAGAPNPWETTTYHLLVTLEEGLEATGALLALRAALATVAVRVGPEGLSASPRTAAHRAGRAEGRPPARAAALSARSGAPR